MSKVVPIVAGALNTTLHETALSEGQAAEVLNCDTGRGIFEVDQRYRRFQLPPAGIEEEE
jgi:hypothetical protein